MRSREEIVCRSVYTFAGHGYDAPMESTPTDVIVEAITRAIVEHRLQPGTKLAAADFEFI